MNIFLDPQPPAVENMLSAMNQRNSAAAVGQVRAVGVDLPSVDIVMDIGCPSRTNMLDNRCPAVAKTRAAGQDFRLMSQERCLAFMELLRLQGIFEQDLNLQGVPDLSAVLQEGLSVCAMR